jgi:hypothetical protein
MIEIKLNWPLGEHSDPFCSQNRCFGPLRSSFYHPQVTTGCDPVPIFKGALGTSRLAAGRRLILMFQSRDGRKGEEPNRAPRVPLDLTALNSPDDTVGPGLGFPQHLASRG